LGPNLTLMSTHYHGNVMLEGSIVALQKYRAGISELLACLIVAYTSRDVLHRKSLTVVGRFEGRKFVRVLTSNGRVELILFRTKE